MGAVGRIGAGIALAALLGGLAPAAGPAPGLRGGPQGLREAAARVAARWGAGDAAGLAGMAAAGGMRLQVRDRHLGPLEGRWLEAALREVFRSRPRGRARLLRVSEVGGDPPRGFAEIRWEVPAPGAGRADAVTVFVGFVREGGWRVAELRVLP